MWWDSIEADFYKFMKLMKLNYIPKAKKPCWSRESTTYKVKCTQSSGFYFITYKAWLGSKMAHLIKLLDAQTGWLEFQPQNLHGGRRKSTPENCPLPSPCTHSLSWTHSSVTTIIITAIIIIFVIITAYKKKRKINRWFSHFQPQVIRRLFLGGHFREG